MDKRIRRVLFIIFWLVIWQVVAVLVNNKILLVGPIETIASLCLMAVTKAFWISLGNSIMRILGGFLLGAFAGFLLAFVSYKAFIFEELLNPLVMTIKSIPVASFVILVLIWFGAPNLSLIISSLVVFPIVYLNTLEGLKNVDTNLLEMAHIFRMKPLTKFRNIYLRALRPFLLSSLSLAIGMAFKSGVAAEVIGRPKFSIGNGIYAAKSYLETGDILAWTIAIILVSYIFEKVIVLIIRRCLK